MDAFFPDDLLALDFFTAGALAALLALFFDADFDAFAGAFFADLDTAFLTGFFADFDADFLAGFFADFDADFFAGFFADFVAVFFAELFAGFFFAAAFLAMGLLAFCTEAARPVTLKFAAKA